MRIISGIYGRRRFQLPSSFKARPTTDFAKENLFNVLNNIFDWEDTEALDLFAGTGSISFEMLSRGCRAVTAVENNRQHAAFIKEVAKELQTEAIRIVKGDVFRFLETAQEESYDFIFADPPYLLPGIKEVPRLVTGKNLLRKDGIFVMEHSDKMDFSFLPQFQQKRIYGAVNFSIFEK